MSSPTPAPEFDTRLRPKTLADFHGQDPVVENLKVAITAAKSRNEAMDHGLLYGPSGLGKTTICGLVAVELGVAFEVVSGPSIKDKSDIRGITTRLEPNQVLFIDEIHGVNRKAEECLYDAMDDFQLRMTMGSGARARILTEDLPRFTLLGATTRPGMLTEALRSRFRIKLELKPYSVEHLAGIITRSSRLLGSEIESSAALDIALCARGVPRHANNLLRSARDYALLYENNKITASAAREALELMGIDQNGLDDTDRRILQLLVDKFEPIGVKAIAASLNLDEETVERISEPHLLQHGFIDRTQRGRMATNKAVKYIKGK